MGCHGPNCNYSCWGHIPGLLKSKMLHVQHGEVLLWFLFLPHSMCLCDRKDLALSAQPLSQVQEVSAHFW